jgi:hypothetical protein
MQKSNVFNLVFDDGFYASTLAMLIVLSYPCQALSNNVVNQQTQKTYLQ